MAEKQIGFCPELLICPGETLKEVLDDRNMSRKELAIRTGVTEKHISKVINGKASITSEFAAALECALQIDAEFWVNLQTNYDIERMECFRSETVTAEEIEIAKQLEKIRAYAVKLGLITNTPGKNEKVLSLRDFARVSNLKSITQLQHCAAYRISSHTEINPYVLFLWQKLCLDLANERKTQIPLDKKKLAASISKIKLLMHLDINTAVAQLHDILGECGITFCVVKHFSGAPVQGYIEQTEAGGLILCLTIRYAFADIFWFTLFHEIAHILYDDAKQVYFDYTFENNEAEVRADKFAGDTLIAPNLYDAFIKNGDFSIQAVRYLAKVANVPTFIVVGRLQKEKRIPYSWHASEKLRYKWTDK